VVSGTIYPNGNATTSHRFEYGTTRRLGSTIITNSSASGSVSQQLTGLQPETTFYYRLSATFRYAFRVYGNTYSFKTLPGSVDLSLYNPPVGNQGPVNSCAAWVAMYSLRGWYAKRDGYYPGGPDSLGGFAPLFSYSQYSQKASQGFNHGFNLQAAAEVMEREGVDTRVDYWQGDFNQIDPPTTTEQTNAANYKIASYQVKGNNGGTSVQEWIEQTLASGNPVAILFQIYSPDVFSNVSAASNYVVYPPPSGSEVVNQHGVFAYGYDRTGVSIENQWGTGWANHGFAKLSWAYVNEAVVQGLSIVPVHPPAPGAQPVGTLVSTSNGSLYRIGGNGPEALSGYAAAGWQTEYDFTEDEALPGISNGYEYDCTLIACSAPDDDPNDAVIKSVQSVP
jgi:hypothetical protein